MNKNEFRFHRGGLQESMDTRVNVRNIDDLVNVINKEFTYGPKITKDEITIEPYGNDKRIAWHTHIVIGPHGVIVFMNGDFYEK